MRALIDLTFIWFFLIAPGVRLTAQGFVLNGTATSLQGNCYRLTADSPWQVGSMFSMNPIDLTQPFSFSATLNFGCKNSNGADGIVFILTTSNTALGAGGGSLGYEGISPSIAVEFDDYLNGWGDPSQDHMAVISNGSVDHTVPSNLFGPFVIAEVEDCEDHCFSFDWNPSLQSLTATLDSDVLTYSVDIVNTIFAGNPNVYYGFSASTGSLSNLQTVCIGPPILVPMDDVTICEGESVQLEADNNGNAWTWDPDPTLSSLNVMSPIATPMQSTSYIVDIGYACGGFEIDTIVVTVLPEPTVVITNNGPLCTGEILNLIAGGGSSFIWSGPAGFFSSNQNPVVSNVGISQAGLYSVTVTDAVGCTTVAMTTVVIFEPTDVEIVSPPVPVCENSETIQLAGIPAPGTWSGEVGVTGIFDPISAGIGLHDIFYTIIDGNGCENTTQISLEVVPTTPALIIPDGPFCVNDPVQILSATPSGGEWSEGANENGHVNPALLGVGTHEVTYTLTDQEGCFDALIFIDILPAPVVEIMDPGPFCLSAPVQMLNASPPGGSWGGVVATDGSIAPGLIGSGLHEVIYNYESPGGCGDSDTLQVLVLGAAPQVSGLTLQCDSLASGYVVTFEITDGDPSSYSVSGTAGMLIPGTPLVYISNPIPTGGAYSIMVNDAHNCNPITLAGNYSCFCATSAGVMSPEPIIVCEGEPITVTPAEGSSLDQDDALVYVLHLGNANTLDSIIMISANGEFQFDTSLIPGVQYYVSAVTGNGVLPIGVDLNDPCLSVAIGTPVIWSPSPSGIMIAPFSFCRFDSVQLMFVFDGNGPFDVVYSDGVQLNTLEDIFNGHTITLSPSQTTTYTLLVISEQSAVGCNAVLEASVTITIAEPMLIQQTISICAGDSIFLAGAMQVDSGLYADSLNTVSGCDSIIETMLLLYPIDTTFVFDTSCDPANVGSTTTSQVDQFGCDSVIVYTVEFAESDTTYLTSGTCDVAMTGTSTQLFTTSEGCDSLVIESISLLPLDSTIVSSLTCDSSDVGVFVQDLVNQYGCDSIFIETVSLAPMDTTTFLGTTCDSSATGVFTYLYQNINGCDSVVIETLQLAPSWFLENSDSTCDPAQSGVFISSYVTQLGCDSVITQIVHLLPTDTVTFIASTCIPADTGTTILTLENMHGCDSLVMIISQLAHVDTCKQNVLGRTVFVPNLFSPNGDGVNDHFFIQANPEAVQTIRLFRIFDRWGALIAEQHDVPPNDLAFGWDGTISNKPCQPGVFVWVAEIEYRDGMRELLRGDVTLVR